MFQTKQPCLPDTYTSFVPSVLSATNTFQDSIHSTAALGHEQRNMIFPRLHSPCRRLDAYIDLPGVVKGSKGNSSSQSTLQRSTASEKDINGNHVGSKLPRVYVNGIWLTVTLRQTSSENNLRVQWRCHSREVTLLFGSTRLDIIFLYRAWIWCEGK